MFCPSCGLEERYSNQYCRACGADLRSVRMALEKPDNITASAAMARDEIGRAFAQKIRETQDAIGMKIVAEDVLPQIEKFLESPEEKRLRRIRTGSIVSFVGLGVTTAFFFTSIFVDKDFLVIAGAGLVTFFIGLAFVINGHFLTVSKKILSDKSDDANSQRRLDVIESKTNELILPEGNREIFSSVTEHTTHQLKKEPIPRR
jgi:hypothetical protein